MKEEVDLPMIVLDYYVISFKEETLEEVDHMWYISIGYQVKRQQ